MIDIEKVKNEMEYALSTGWDRDNAIKHGLEVIEFLENSLNSAILDLKTYSNPVYRCDICENHIPCIPEACPDFISGVGAVIIGGQEIPDWKWTCEDFNIGDCPAREKTPCHGCDFSNNWEWRGAF